MYLQYQNFNYTYILDFIMNTKMENVIPWRTSSGNINHH